MSDPNPVLYGFVLPVDLAARWATFLRDTNDLAYRHFLVQAYALLEYQTAVGGEALLGTVCVAVRAQQEALAERFLASNGMCLDRAAWFEPLPGRRAYPLRPVVGPAFTRPVDKFTAQRMRAELLAGGHLPPDDADVEVALAIMRLSHELPAPPGSQSTGEGNASQS